MAKLLFKFKTRRKFICKAGVLSLKSFPAGKPAFLCKAPAASGDAISEVAGATELIHPSKDKWISDRSETEGANPST